MANFGLVLFLTVALASTTAFAQLIPNQFIVKLKPTANAKATASWVESKIEESTREGVSTFQERVLRSYNINGDFQGFAGKFDQSTLEKLKSNPDIEAIIPDGIVKKFGSQSDAVWGLSRISQKTKPDLARPYVYPDVAGEGVTAYVVDTGINIKHPDFEGRATWGFKSDPNWADEDADGHGTHVAGTIGSKTYGVAKKVKLVAVRVLDDNGSGTYSGIIAAIEWLANQVKGNKKNVANLSLGGPKHEALNAAMEAAVKAGVNFAVAAGNENQDACNVSPASADGLVTVAASDKTDQRADFSNWGAKCVTVFGPGVDITSTSKTGETETMSGTSMASPHVAGVMALYLSQNPDLTPAQLKALIVKNATSKTIKDTKKAPNKLVYVTVAKRRSD